MSEPTPAPIGKKKHLASVNRAPEPQEGEVVAQVRQRPKVKTGKPSKLSRTASMKSASSCSGGGLGGGGSTGASYGNYYSPELSTDFLELPQSKAEQWAYYRFFYESDPFVGQAIDLHTELPLSRVRLDTPKAQNRELALRAQRFCARWAKDIGLLRILWGVMHEYHLIGVVNIYIEDNNPEMPENLRVHVHRELREDGAVIEEEQEYEDADERTVKWLKKNYKGWTGIRVIPPEQVHSESFPSTDMKLVEMVPDAKTRKLVEAAESGDKRSQRIVETMAPEIVEAARTGQNVPLNTDPDAGSFLYVLENKKSPYQDGGRSILGRCIRTLVFWDKIRQAQTSIASRHMTPIRIVYAEGMDATDTEDLRNQVDMALQDPDFSIVSNFQITWEEMGADQRLLDLSNEYDLVARQLYAGLGVTEGLLTGESSYSGDRIHLDVINTRYMLLREVIQEFVEEALLKPMCRRMGFIEEDEDGREVVVYPKFSFTRLALRDNADTFDAMYNLYQKGSLDIDSILDLLNIDPVTTREKLQRDAFTFNDATFNEVLRGIYSGAGNQLAENSDVVEIIARNLGLKYEKPKEEGGRY